MMSSVHVVAVHLHDLNGDQLYYIRSAKTGIDVDFYVPEENLAIQVAYSLDDDDARHREISNLCKLGSENPGLKLMIVTYNEEEKIEAEGHTIEVMPCYKFLVKGNM